MRRQLSVAERHALRFRIWQYAAPREWDVTTTEIAEALGASWQSVSAAIHTAGWDSRVRHGTCPIEFNRGLGPFGGAQRSLERITARDILAGRVEAGTL